MVGYYGVENVVVAHDAVMGDDEKVDGTHVLDELNKLVGCRLVERMVLVLVDVNIAETLGAFGD